MLAVLLDEGQKLRIGRLLPTADGDAPVLGISPEDDALAPEAGNPRSESLRVFDGDAAARYHLRPAVEGDLYILCLLQSAPEVDDEAGMSRQLFEHAIIDDMPVDELMEIIKATDKNGKSDFKIITEFGDELIWDYRDYSRDFDNSLLKGEIQRIREGYESEEY